jgi:two-component system OmpR family sensor kinase
MSIRVRLTIYWAGVLSLLLIGAGVCVFFLFQRQQWTQLDAALREEADTAAATLARNGEVGPLVDRLSEERDLGPRRRVWVVVGQRLVADAGEHNADLPLLNHNHTGPILVDGQRHIFRYALAPFWLNRSRAYLADGVDAHAIRASVRRLGTILLVVVPALLLSSTCLGYWLAGRALAPLVMVTGALAAIRPTDLDHRLVVPPLEDELGKLVREINSLLSRVERASLAERRFIADAAHELRTPLTVLRTGIEVALRHRRSAAEYRHALDKALRDAVAIGTLADELLAVARLDQELISGRQIVKLPELTREVLDIMEPLAESKRLSVESNLVTAANVLGNPDHLRRVLINLLDNAVKFTPENGKIEVTLQSEKGQARLQIADSGPGVLEQDLPFIFDRFFRGRNARGHPGKGLGLSLSREIVQLHGGWLTVTNRIGGGAEFSVYLPIAQMGD